MARNGHIARRAIKGTIRPIQLPLRSAGSRCCLPWRIPGLTTHATTLLWGLPPRKAHGQEMRSLPRLALRCFVLVFLSASFSQAQNNAPKPLIVEKVNESQLLKQEGNTPPAASAQNDRGRVSPGLRMADLVLVL